ncbi:zinc finger protein 827 isoform X2 [Sorex fumeus]|nr:zinc finger protein 827 isoform X2 [Sorex fumeus]XP_055974969.1 zinc finger protein 827 isoform X2 [Sorex fumeus]XP_055974970.1 zinc finger protein 827 isoform X2 [Sorex fumeus]
MPRRKQEQPKRLPSHVSRQDEAEGELSEGEPWYGNSSETPSEASYGEVQENYKLSLEDRIHEQSTSPDTSLGSATPSSHTLELVALDGEVLRDSLQCQGHLSPSVSSLCDDDPPGSAKPLSSNLRRLLEAGSLKLDAAATPANGRAESPVAVGANLSFSPPSHHAQQLSVLARKLAEKQDPNDQYTPSNRFIWNQGKWLPNSTTTCGLSPDSAILKLKAAANAVLQDKSLARTEETMRFEPFSSPFSAQSASSTLAALSKKVSERSLTPGQEHLPPASSFLSLASMTSSAALLKEVAARAAGSLLAEKSSLVPEDALPPPPSEKKPEKVSPPPPPPPPPPQSLELLLLPVPKGRVSKPSSSASEEESGKPFQCPICGLVIKRKSYWKRHMVIHTGLKSHQCPLCPFRCARKDNLKSHMKVHQHQDRGETFQCQLCPFTSSRHFSLKLHMRCHQHFLRTEAKVKEEIPDPDVKGSPHLSDSACLGQQREGAGTEPERTSQGGAGVSPVLVKEEPKEDNGLPASFPLSAAGRPAKHTKLKEPPECVASGAAALFSQDISVKMASDFLMKLSAANQKEPMNLHFKVKEEPKDEETLGATVPRSSYVFSPESDVPAPGIAEDTLKTQEGKGNVLRRDMSVKAASELLMKLSAESFKETQMVRIKEEPMEVDIQDAYVSVSPSRNVGYSTLIGREKAEPLQKVPEGRMPPERNLFSQDISVKMASELLFQLSEKVSKEHNHTKENTIQTTTSPFFSEDTFRQSPFTSNSKDLLPSDPLLPGRISAPETEKIVLEAGNGLPSWKFNDQLFPCDVCGKVFGRQQTLSRHLSLHTEERKYKCHLCPYAAKCRANLNQHLTVHSVKLVSTDAEDLVSAVTSEGGDGKKHPYYYSCHVCGFETELNVQFVSHMSLHVDKEQWMFSICCTACDFVTMEEAEIKTHIGTKHTGEDRKTPSESNSPSSSSLSALSDSANSKDDSDSSQKNKSGSNLLVISVVPGSQPSLNSEEKPEKGFECVFCNFVCKTKNMFERHLQIHLITRMFECDVCHKFMKTPEQLLEHKKCHTVPTGGLK